MRTEVDDALEQGRWSDWRASRKGDASALADGALAWCASERWKANTPHLEDWKDVVGDLRGGRLSEQAVRSMAAARPTGLPFPAIPLFETEQVGDFSSTLADLDAGAAFVEILTRANGLDLGGATPASICWTHIDARVKAGLTESAWMWLVPGAVSPDLPFPSPSETAILLPQGHAVQQLEEAVRRRLATATGAALAVADALGLWRKPTFVEWAVRTVLQNDGPPEIAARALAAVDAQPHAVPIDADALGRLKRLAARVTGVGPVWLAGSGEFDEPYWNTVAQQVQQRSRSATEVHPLTELSDQLLRNELTVPVPTAAEAQFLSACQRFPVLVQTDPACPFGPLPALNLAMAVRPDADLGAQALAIVQAASIALRSQWWWWRSLDVAMRRTISDGADDHQFERYLTARRLLRLHAGRLTTHERDAMDRTEPLTVYAPESASYSIKYQRSRASETTPFATVRRTSSAAGRQQGAGAAAGAALAVYLQAANDVVEVSVDAPPHNDYEPPRKLFIVGWGNGFHETPLPPRHGALRVRSDQHIIVPVDRPAEDALRRSLEGLKGLPTFSHLAALEGRVESREADRRRETAATAPPSSSHHTAGPNWLWVGAAALVGLLVGTAIVLSYQSLTAPGAATEETKSSAAAAEGPASVPDKTKTEAQAGTIIGDVQPPSSPAQDPAITKALDDFKAALPKTKDETIKALAKAHATDQADSWLVTKIALLSEGKWPSKSTASSGSLNKEAAERFKANAASLSVPLRAAITAVLCRVPDQVLPTSDCGAVDVQDATAGLETLTAYLAAPPGAGADRGSKPTGQR